MLRFIHLQYAAAYTARPLGRRDRNAFVALAFAVDVVIVGDNRATGQLEHRLAAAGDPVTFVGVGPGDRALGVDLFGDFLELSSVLRGVPVEVVAVLLAIAVADDVVDAHGVSVIRMACSGQECAASRTASSWSAATSSETADAWPSMSSSSKDSGAIIEHSVCPWQRSGSTRTFTTFPLCVSATIDAEDLAGDVAGFLGYQKRARRRDVLGLAHPAYRCCRNGLFDVAEIPAFLRAAQHRGVDETRWYRVDGDAVRPVLQCQRLGQPVDGGFGRD